MRKGWMVSSEEGLVLRVECGCETTKNPTLRLHTKQA